MQRAVADQAVMQSTAVEPESWESGDGFRWKQSQGRFVEKFFNVHIVERRLWKVQSSVASRKI